MSKTITIDEDKFIDILGSTSAKFCKTELDILKFAIFCGEVHTALFGDDEDTEAPFKVGDKYPEAHFKAGDIVFVIGNEGDYNKFVNRVVTVVKVYDDKWCHVTDGKHDQKVCFKNLRKVKTS